MDLVEQAPRSLGFSPGNRNHTQHLTTFSKTQEIQLIFPVETQFRKIGTITVFPLTGSKRIPTLLFN